MRLSLASSNAKAALIGNYAVLDMWQGTGIEARRCYKTTRPPLGSSEPFCRQFVFVSIPCPAMLYRLLYDILKTSELHFYICWHENSISVPASG